MMPQPKDALLILVRTAVVLGALLLITVQLAAAPVTVFVVGSYLEDDLCSGPQYRGVLSALEGSGLDYRLRSFFLDSRHLPAKAIKQKGQTIGQRIETERPRVLVTIDDAAFRLLAPMALQHPKLFLVFSGLNRSLDTYDRELHFLKDRVPTKNITGVYERLFMVEQMRFYETLLGDLGVVAILHSTDPMGKLVAHQIRDELDDTPYRQHLLFLPVATMKDFEQAVHTVVTRADIHAYMPILLSVRDETTGKHQTIKDLAPLLIKTIDKPDIALNKAFTKVGFLGGVSVDFFHMGYQAGTLAVQLLRGTPVQQLPVELAERYVVTLNRRRLSSLPIPVDDDFLNTID